MRQADLARPGNGAAANQARIGNGVVGRAIGPDAHQTRARFQHARDAVNLGGLNRFVKGEGRQDGGNALGQHGFAGAGRPDHQNVVATRRGHFNGAFGVKLALDVAKIHSSIGRPAPASPRC